MVLLDYLLKYPTIISYPSIDPVMSSSILRRVLALNGVYTYVLIPHEHVVRGMCIGRATVVGVPLEAGYEVVDDMVLISVGGGYRGAYLVGRDLSRKPIEEVEPVPKSLTRFVVNVVRRYIGGAFDSLAELADERVGGELLRKASAYVTYRPSALHRISDAVYEGRVDEVFDSLESLARRYDERRSAVIADIVGRAIRIGDFVVTFYGVLTDEEVYVREVSRELLSRYGAVAVVGVRDLNALTLSVTCRPGHPALSKIPKVLEGLNYEEASASSTSRYIVFKHPRPRVTEVIRLFKERLFNT
ncbi:MAG: hypothetical protein B6U73_04175 [Desulfurococcales archaeon ex4484_204]|nr:MAG: hypothetical protein B6U73_04175 [Desulfurococcales archaeon ex4484_204]